jgi:hypothetical protein
MLLRVFKFTIIMTIILFIALCAQFIINCNRAPEQNATSYWLWAGLTQSDAPAGSELYVYQGDIKVKDGILEYKRAGLYPHPIKSKKLYLVYRLEGGLPSADAVLSIFSKALRTWKRHQVNITGLQLDFDSPTSKLLIYSNFLKEVRNHLPQEYALSITGLGEWAIYGDSKIMQSIAEVTNEIIFQLYNGRRAHANIEYYLEGLKKYPFPFRVGLLYSDLDKNYLDVVKKNTNYKGVVYFIQKTS